MKKSRIILGPLMAVCLLVLSSVLFSGYDNDSLNLYRVTVASHEDAERLEQLDVDVLIRTDGGYLVLGKPPVAEYLARSGLIFDLIYSGLSRANLMTVTERSPKRIDRLPLIFDENGLRLYHVRDGLRETAMRDFHLRPMSSRHLPVSYDRPFEMESDPGTSQILDTLLNRINTDSLESYLYRLESYDNRWWGTTGNSMSRVWIYNELRNYGYDSVYLDEFSGFGVSGIYGEGQNVVAVKPGTVYPEIHIVIGGHFDSGSGPDSHYPGADDNGSGTGGVMELARAMADVDTRYTWVFILFDAEEAWMVGSLHYATNAAAENRKIVLMMNLDMIGHEENETEAYLHYYLNDEYAQLWTHLADSIPGIGITGHVTDEMGLVSDQGPFAEAGYDVIFVQEYEFSTHYHLASDSAIYLDFDYMNRMVQVSLAAAYVTDQEYEPGYEMHLMPAGDYPDLVYPGLSTPVALYAREYGGAQIVPGSVLLHYSINGGGEAEVPMIYAGDDLYTIDFPALNCGDNVSYYFSVEEDSLGIMYYPGPGTDESFLAGVGTGLFTVYEDYIDPDHQWTFETEAEYGGWELYETTSDYDGSGYCFRSTAGISSIFNGFTSLFSPSIETGGTNCNIEFAYKFRHVVPPDPGDQPDSMEVFISENGYDWIKVHTFYPGNSREWKTHKFSAGGFLTAPQTIWLRFDAIESGGDNYIMASVDAVKINGTASDLRIVTEEIPNWTAGHPFSYQLEAAVCNDDTLIWNDRFDQLDDAGMSLSESGLISGIPTRVGPVVFRAEVSDQSGGYYEKSMDFIVYDSLKISTLTVPAADLDESYACQLKSSGGTGTKDWSDLNGGLEGSGLSLESDGYVTGTGTSEGNFPFVARVTDAVGASTDREFTLRVIGPYVCGDANGDGNCNVGDAVHLINYIFKEGPAPDPIEAGDANGDGEVNVGDAVYIINYVFNGGPAPVC